MYQSAIGLLLPFTSKLVLHLPDSGENVPTGPPPIMILSHHPGFCKFPICLLSLGIIPNTIFIQSFVCCCRRSPSRTMETADSPPPLKRTRNEELTTEDIMYKARFIFGCDPFKAKAPETEDKKFRALFGCSAVVMLALWSLLVEHDVLPPGGKLIHLFWALMFVKVYPTEETLTKLCKDPTGRTPDRKTVRKWIRLFMTAVSYLTDMINFSRFNRG